MNEADSQEPLRPRTLLIVAGILILAVIAWAVLRPQPTATPQTGSTANQTSSTRAAAAPQIRSAKDLNTADQTLNQNDPSSSNNSDLTQLTDQTNSF